MRDIGVLLRQLFCLGQAFEFVSDEHGDDGTRATAFTNGFASDAGDGGWAQAAFDGVSNLLSMPRAANHLNGLKETAIEQWLQGFTSPLRTGIGQQMEPTLAAVGFRK